MFPEKSAPFFLALKAIRCLTALAFVPLSDVHARFFAAIHIATNKDFFRFDKKYFD